jgi:polar amino acid transport system substrate-binding protein
LPIDLTRSDGDCGEDGGRRRALRGLGGLALSLLPIAAPAQTSQPSQPTPSRELRVVGTRFERIYERQSNGDFTGMGVELVRLAARRFDYQVRFELYPWRRAQHLVTEGGADVLVGPYKSAERLKTMRFSEQAFFQDQVAFYVRALEIPLWEGDYAALRSKRIAIMNGWSYGAAFTEALPRLHTSVTNTVESGLQMLLHNHVDLFASNRRDTDPVILALRATDKLLALAPLIDVQNGYLAFSLKPRLAGLATQFDRLLEEMKARGELSRLARKYELPLP